ncbi:MAG: GNAT family N-acetyltransferase [Epsilonproteobacteria bacterium]|nr:GNAT family N-acetyltransferase [Campylobacterota bacterium]
MIITTKRLLLRLPTNKNIKDIVKISNFKVLSLKLSSLPYPYSEDSAKEWIKKANSSNYIGFLIEFEKEVVGVINIDISKEHNHATISYYLAPQYWNKKIMSEAVGGVVDFCFNKLNLIRVAAHHFHTNMASGKVLLRNNFLLEGIRRKHFKKENEYLDIYDYGILKESLC